MGRADTDETGAPGVYTRGGGGGVSEMDFKMEMEEIVGQCWRRVGLVEGVCVGGVGVGTLRNGGVSSGGREAGRR